MSSSRAGGVAQAPHALALRGGGRLPSFAVNLLVEQLASQEAGVKVIKAFTRMNLPFFTLAEVLLSILFSISCLNPAGVKEKGTY